MFFRDLFIVWIIPQMLFFFIMVVDLMWAIIGLKMLNIVIIIVVVYLGWIDYKK
jgi:hypothetical protein